MSHHEWNIFSRTALNAAVMIVVAVASAPALAQNTTSALSGRVTGADGKPVAGAKVMVVHNESGSSNTVTTDDDGRYSARALRAGGPYTITISKGRLIDKREGVFLALAETLALDGQLGSAAETIVVTGRNAAASKINSSTMGAGTNLGSAELTAYASIQRNLQDYARLDPRVAQTDKERGEISVAGQNSRFNSLTIDGVTTSDTFGLESNGFPTLKQPISIEAIQSVQVNVSNYDVSQKGYTGANINAVTKSGTNDWHGSLYYVYRDDKLAGDRYNRVSDSFFAPPVFKESTKGFTLGGPIIQDKLFLFGSYEEFRSTRNSPSFGPVGDAAVNVAITPAAIASAISIAKSTYNIDIGTFNPAGSEALVKDTLLKLDWNISDQHRASLRYAKTEEGNPIFSNFTASQLALTSNLWTQAKAIETTVGQWFADWTPNFSTELKYSRRDYNSAPNNVSTLPQVSLQFINALPVGMDPSTPTSRQLFFGTERSRHFNLLKTKTDDVYAAGTFTVGGHEIKGGLDSNDNKVYNAFLQDVYGSYLFRCVNSSATYAYTSLPGGINCGTATAIDIEKATLENFQRGRPFTYTQQLPQAGRTLQDGAAIWSVKDTGYFLQDTWKVNKQLTLMGGVRVDTQSVPDKPIVNANVGLATVAGNAATNVRQTGGFGLDNSVTIDGQNLVQPRLGFNLNLDTEDKRKQQVRGGLGLFQGAAASVWLSNPFSNTGVAITSTGCGGSFAACSSAGGQFSADVNNQPKFSLATPAANVDVIEKGLGQPAVWKANLAWDAELPFWGLTAGAEWLHTQVKQGIYYKHLNLGTVTKTGTDGRDLYYNANGYNTNCWSATGSTNSSGAGCAGVPIAKALNNASFGNVLLASKTNKGEGDAITLSLSQQPLRNLSWTVGFTRSSATEVSPLTSSTSNSNWLSRSIFNPNDDVAATSAYLVRNRVSAAVNWSAAFVGSYKTTLGLFYEGRAGHPYSWTFNNDLNGDGAAGNDLMYIPTAQGSGEVIFAGGATEEARFWEVVNSNSELKNSMGKVVKRNGSFSPFINTVDMRISQELPGITAKHKSSLSIDFLNIGNLINKRWGRTNETLFQSAGGAARSFVNYKGLDASGKYIYAVMPAVESLETRQAKGESQWAVQVTLKYEF